MDQEYSLLQIQAEVERLAAKIEAPAHLLPTYGFSEDGARPHMEVDSQGYHYVVVERGQEISRMTTNTLDELLYYVFEGVTFALACNYELKYRIANQDARRQIFQRQIELLAILSPKWAELEARDHERILRQHPFVDSLTQG